MEQLLHYIWKHRIFPLTELHTQEGKSLEIINPGIWNHNAGPDFLGAKIKIDGVLWAGNIEIHMRTSDWFRHNHDKDTTYHNIILHVANIIDQPLFTPDGKEIPQLQLPIPSWVEANYHMLSQNDRTPRCAHIIPQLPTLTVHAWLSALQVERLEMRNQQILERRELLDKNWEATLFVTLSRSIGLGINGDAFEAWAQSIPMSAVGKHRDNLFQIEAIFFGQAGFLEKDPQSAEGTGDTQCSSYPHKLYLEYKYLRQKFSLTPIDVKKWKFLRLRPQNFPHIRIAQLAMLYYTQSLNLSRLISKANDNELKPQQKLNALHELLKTQVSEYWQTHYTLKSSPSAQSVKTLTIPTMNIIVINAIIPTLFSYGIYKSNQQLCDSVIDILEQIPPEDNHHIREWQAAGITCQSASDSQALLQLTHKYCDTHDCLRCRFGYEFIKSTPGFLQEE